MSIAALLMLSTVAFADHDHDRDHDRDREGHVGIAQHSGTGRVTHDGDYVDFSFDFSASCYADQHTPWNKVAANVETFLAWLNSQASTREQGTISYTADLINTWRSDAWDDNTACHNRYYARQNVRVTLSRPDAQEYLDEGFIQDFFQEVQIAISPLNQLDDGDTNAWIASNVSSVEKGVYEETAELLRIAAKSKAQAKATRDFLAFLGEDYQGWWHLHAVDFGNNDHYGRLYEDVALAPSAAREGEVGRALSVLKLEPLSVELEGNFVFHFKTRDHYLP